ncbi:ABC transporter ATP-binding protein [Colwellia sp. MEBiC06753]
MSTVLTLEQLHVVIDNQAILTDVSFTLASGEILGLVGPSGCGKTTLLNTIAGFIAQQSGDISLQGLSPITPEHMVAPELRHVGMIFQDYALFPHLTVEQNIGFGITKMSKAEQQIRINQLLSMLELAEFNHRYPHQLSGGQQQRVAIARAIATRPKLLLLDEPFSNIDSRLRQSLMLELRQLLKSLNMSAIFVTHNKDEVFTFADKMAVMAEGNILQFGAPADICQAPNSYQVADFLQLGSWVACLPSATELRTALGNLKFDNTQYAQLPLIAEQASAYLLLKPQYLEISADDSAELEIVHINVTEHGFHYHLASINQDDELSISQLSVYSPQIFALHDKVAVTVIEHEYLLYPCPAIYSTK